MGRFELVVIAASAGGVQALTTLVSELPEDFPLPVVIVQHVDPHHPSLLVDILARHAQNEETSDFYGMPGAAQATGAIDFVLPLHEIAPKLVTMIAAVEGSS